jgi:pyruvate/2-oxoglutarate/acetoin dehydrogenase E1 component
MNYVEFVNSELKKEICLKGAVALFGQNIDAGSRLGGLTRGLSSANSGLTINTPNSENLLAGLGFGLMFSGVSSIYFVKQTDFLMLGSDHFVNTYNIFCKDRPDASFTIIPVCVDSGYEGPQSSLNNLDDFSALSGIPTFSISTAVDAEKIIKKYLFAKGIQVLCMSQRLMRSAVIDRLGQSQNDSADMFRYKVGLDVCIICFNFSITYGLELSDRLATQSINASLFSINRHSSIDLAPIKRDLEGCQKIVITIDDSKSVSRLSESVLVELEREGYAKKNIVLARDKAESYLDPCSDHLEIDYVEIISQVICSVRVNNEL